MAIKVHNGVQVPATGLQVGTSTTTNYVLTADSAGNATWQASTGGATIGDFKQSVRVASTANVTIPPGGTSLVMDGITLATADRVLLKNQTAPAENGIYDVGGVGTSVTLTRSSDANTALYTSDSTLVNVQQGAAAADTAWELVTDNPITLGTTPLYWTRAWPSYMENGIRNPWAATGTICQNFERTRWTANTALPTAATWVFMGGGVLSAGRPVTNVTVMWTTAGTVYTIRHFSIVRASDMTVLQRTANAATVPAGNTFLTTPLQAAYTSPVDVPIYVVLGVASSTAGNITMTGTTGISTITAIVPCLSYTSTTTPPTTTPPTVGATLPTSASGTATSNVGCYYLT